MSETVKEMSVLQSSLVGFLEQARLRVDLVDRGRYDDVVETFDV